VITAINFFMLQFQLFNMTEKVLFKNESRKNRDEIAEYLEKIVEKLKGSGELSFSSGEKKANLQVPESAEFEIKVEEEGLEKSVEFEIEWSSQDSGDDESLEIS